MLPDRVSNPRPLTYESGALPIALRGPVLGDQARRARVVLPAGRRCPTARLCSRRAACGAKGHPASSGWGPQALNNSSM